MLYCSLAFYEYEDNTFWPQFARAVEANALSPNQQTDINNAMAQAAKDFGLQLRRRGNGTDYVGSAVQYTGITL